jgi:hypothetical protein
MELQGALVSLVVDFVVEADVRNMRSPAGNSANELTRRIKDMPGGKFEELIESAPLGTREGV